MGGLPQDAPDFTPAWLSEVMGREVTDVELLGRTVATNLHLRLGLRYGQAGAGPPTVFVKLAPLDPVHREAIGASGMGGREARFYAEAASQVPLRVPRSWFAATEADGSFLLVLEDLAATGCEVSDGTWGIPADLATGALEDLARFHVQYEHGGVPGWASEPRATGGDFTLRTLRYVLDRFRDLLSADYVEVGELYLAHHQALEALWDAGPRTFAHGDAHIGNVFVDGQRVGFFDWGLSNVCGPMRDVSYFLAMAVEPDAADAHPALVRHYLDARRAAGGTEIGFDEAWLAHRRNAGYTVIASFLGLVPPYDTEETRPFATMFRERSMAALEHLESVPVLRAAR